MQTIYKRVADGVEISLYDGWTLADGTQIPKGGGNALFGMTEAELLAIGISTWTLVEVATPLGADEVFDSYSESVVGNVITRTEVNRAMTAQELVDATPSVVTMRQARLALRQSGLLAAVDAAVVAMTGDAGTDAQIEWEFSSTVDRNMPLVAGLAAGLGFTSVQLDALFRLAETL